MNVDKMLEIALANAPLVVMLGTAYAWLTPKIIKSTLMNGGGEVVKRIVRECNAEQSIETQEHFARVRERLSAVEAIVKRGDQ